MPGHGDSHLDAFGNRICFPSLVTVTFLTHSASLLSMYISSHISLQVITSCVLSSVVSCGHVLHVLQCRVLFPRLKYCKSQVTVRCVFTTCFQSPTCINVCCISNLIYFLANDMFSSFVPVALCRVSVSPTICLSVSSCTVTYF